ncbi:uncharacterized protein LOC124461886 [Drosophila willistoni]|uniref:uncharacterized protein LOC124461886 n=1 Tax=Drosophila willistoni TaxID=7260 RepID=UPI001F072D97|nr:uncharacterized protein LOC124461886 [Drosophila willistoni]
MSHYMPAFGQAAVAAAATAAAAAGLEHHALQQRRPTGTLQNGKAAADLVPQPPQTSESTPNLTPQEKNISSTARSAWEKNFDVFGPIVDKMDLLATLRRIGLYVVFHVIDNWYFMFNLAKSRKL